MSRASVVDRANELLDSIGDALPMKVNEITVPSDDIEIATWRKADGYPVIAPHPESQSMLTGERRFFDFIEQAPGIIQELLDLVNDLVNSPAKKEANTE